MRFLAIFFGMFAGIGLFLLYLVVTSGDDELSEIKTLRVGSVVKPVQYVPEEVPDTRLASAAGVRRPVRRADLERFFIGFSGFVDTLRLIALDIAVRDTLADAAQDTIEFDYVLNTRMFREEGRGAVFTRRDSIAFVEKTTGKMLAGKMYREGQTLVFESINQDSILHWKMKEKVK